MNLSKSSKENLALLGFIIRMGIITVTIIAQLVLIINYKKVPNDYSVYIIMPIIFMFFYLTIYKFIEKMNKLRITMWFLIIGMWPKLVLLPLFSVLTANFSGFTYLRASSTSIQLANYLIVYEFIIASLVLFFLSNRLSIIRSNDSNKFVFWGSKTFYKIFVLLSLVIFFVFSRSSNLINLFFIPSSQLRMTSTPSSLDTLFVQIIIIGFGLISLLGIDKYRKKYEIAKKNKYFIYSLLFALINVFIIIGERRSSIIYATFVFIIILLRLFPSKKSTIIKMLVGTGIVIFSIMSLYKVLNIFIEGSYISSIKQTDFSIEWIFRNAYPYMGNPINIGVAIEMAEVYSLSIFNLLFDFLRSIFGFNFLLKNQGFMTTEMYNQYIYQSLMKTSGHTLTSVAYGYIYFGFLLSPLVISLNILISSLFERMVYKAKSYEGLYLTGYLLVRFSTITATTPPLLSGATITLFTVGLVFLASKFIRDSIKSY